MGRPVRSVAVLAVAACLAAAPVAAQTRLSRDEGRAFASELLSTGQPQAAEEVLRALLEADPTDVIALVLMSRSARAQGDRDRALEYAARAWAAAATPEHRFAAAVVRAQAHATDTPGPLAVWWMRRALELAPDDNARSFALAEGRAYRRESPLAVTLSFGLAPRSNINGGGANTVYDLHPAVVELLRELLGDPDLRPQGTLGDEERPLSGLEVSAGLTLRYRLAETPDRLTDVTMRLSGRTYRLSSDAQETAPDAHGSNFADTVLSFGLSHRWSSETGTWGLDVEAGRVWYGGEVHSDVLRGTLGHTWELADEASLTLDGTLAGTWFGAADAEPQREVGIGLRWSRPVGDGGRLDLGAGLTELASDTPDRSYRSLSLDLGWRFLEDGVAGIDLGLEHRRYDETRYIAETREDLVGTLTASYALTDWEVMGFAPVATLTARTLRSNAERPETSSIGAGLTWRSSF